ncbi:hypothetical protein BGZ98_009235 [Dissophora globulifera]|nr:hypothetical protein BGZ98_009235 [Dissophora globulifera]
MPTLILLLRDALSVFPFSLVTRFCTPGPRTDTLKPIVTRVPAASPTHRPKATVSASASNPLLTISGAVAAVATASNSNKALPVHSSGPKLLAQVSPTLVLPSHPTDPATARDESGKKSNDPVIHRSIQIAQPVDSLASASTPPPSPPLLKRTLTIASNYDGNSDINSCFNTTIGNIGSTRGDQTRAHRSFDTSLGFTERRVSYNSPPLSPESKHYPSLTPFLPQEPTTDASLGWEGTLPTTDPSQHVDNQLDAYADISTNEEEGRTESEDEEIQYQHRQPQYQGGRFNNYYPRRWAKPFKKFNDRRLRFLPYVQSIESIPEDVRYWHDESHFIIKDRYPKAKVHYLVMPREFVTKLHQLTGDHGIEVVKGLQNRGEWLIERLKEENPHLSFGMGFHVMPSMLQVHLHVISLDFCSNHLKWLEHYNSFTTAFFIHPTALIRIIAERGQFWLQKPEISWHFNQKRSPLRCNQCEFSAETIKDLKLHLEEHLRQRMEAIRPLDSLPQED